MTKRSTKVGVAVALGAVLVGVSFCALQRRQESPEEPSTQYADYRTRLVRVGMTKGYPILMKLQFTPDGQYIVVAAQASLVVFRVSDMAVVSQTKPGMSYIAVHPSGSYVACGTIDGIIRLHSLPDGQLIRTFQVDLNAPRQPEGGRPDTGYGEVTRMAFSPDGKYLAVKADPFKEVFVYRTEDWGLERLVHGDRSAKPRDLVFSPDSSMVGVWDSEAPENEDYGRTTFYDVHTGEPRLVLSTPWKGTANVFRVSPDASRFIGRSLALGVPRAEMGRICIWTAATASTPEWLLEPLPQCVAGACSPDGRTILCGGEYIGLIDVASHETFFLAKLPSGGGGVISPDGQYAAVTQGWNYVFLFDIRKDAPPRPILTEPPAPGAGQGAPRDQGGTDNNVGQERK